MTRVSVIVPCRNEVQYIEQCIKHIVSNASDQIDIEVFVVDGMSDDGTRALLNELKPKYPSVGLIDNPDRLTPIAFNIGIRRSQSEYVLIVGARQLLDPSYISECIKVLNAEPTIGCVGGKVENEYLNRTGEYIALAMASPFGVGAGNFRILETEAYVDTVGTPMYRREIFDSIGLFDESLARNQDDELNFRLRQQGYKIKFLPQARLRYFVRGNFKNLFRQYFQYGYWKVFVNKKHKTVTTIRQLFPALWLLFLALGWLPGLFLEVFLLFYAATIALYLLAALYFAVRASKNIRQIVNVFISFMILHLSYGSGYLQGIWHFFILNKQPARRAAKLSR